MLIEVPEIYFLIQGSNSILELKYILKMYWNFTNVLKKA